QAKRNLIALSLPSEARFIHDWTDGDTQWPACPCRTMDLYAAYLAWCRQNGETRPRPSNQFLGYIAHMPGWDKKKARIYSDYNCTGGTRPEWIIFPPDEVLQRSGRELTAGSQQSVWLTECCLDFKGASAEKGAQ